MRGALVYGFTCQPAPLSQDKSLTTDYLVEAVRQGEMPPLSGDTIAEIAPFLEKGG